MPRQIRIEYRRAIYHVMSGGDRQEAIVCEDGDRELWVRTLGEACTKTAGQALQGREVAILRTDPLVSVSTCDLNRAFSAPFIIRRIIPGAMPQAFA
jgi:hypothetical protein